MRDRSALKAMREARKAAGLCGQCGSDALGFATCWHCREQRARRYRKACRNHSVRKGWRIASRKRAGAIRAAETKRKAERRAAGLCIHCCEPSKKFAACVACRAKKSEQHAERRRLVKKEAMA